MDKINQCFEQPSPGHYIILLPC